MSVVVVPMSTSRASGCVRDDGDAVAAQFAAATRSGSRAPRPAVTKRPSTVNTRTGAAESAASTASSTNATPSRLVRNICESSAVIVTACASIAAAARRFGGKLAQETAPCAVRAAFRTGAHAAATWPSTTRPIFVFEPPMSQPTIMGLRTHGKPPSIAPSGAGGNASNRRPRPARRSCRARAGRTRAFYPPVVMVAGGPFSLARAGLARARTWTGSASTRCTWPI